MIVLIVDVRKVGQTDRKSLCHGQQGFATQQRQSQGGLLEDWF
jgi:hypothetical protein